MRATSKPWRCAGGIEHRVVAGALGAEAEVVAHQHVLRAQAAHQHVVDEGLGNLGRQPGIERKHHALVDAAARQFGQLVAQGGDAGGRQFGLARQRPRSSRADAARRSARSWARRGAAPRCSAAPAWPGGRGARRRNCRWSARRRGAMPGVVEASEDLHRGSGRYLFDSSSCPSAKHAGRFAQGERARKQGILCCTAPRGAGPNLCVVS